jgi:hypothetical protein
MKQLLALSIGILASIAAHANCITGALWIFPQGPTIKQNPVFVLTGMGERDSIILGLNTKYNIYLKSGETKVSLLVMETHFGQNQMQAFLKPEYGLEEGREYALCIDSVPGLELYSSRGLVSYKVLGEKDRVAPQVGSRPKELGKNMIYAGCGPIEQVVFSNPAKSDSDVIVRTTLINLKTGYARTFYLEPYGPQRDYIEVGHGMCSGAFAFEAGGAYEVEFQFMDACGNMTAWTGERIRFTAPEEGAEFGYR